MTALGPTDGWCLSCGEEFHLDDTGGYNPPCGCAECGGAYCRSCCREEREGDADYNAENADV